MLMFRLSVQPKIIIKNFVVFVLASFQDSLGMRLVHMVATVALFPDFLAPEYKGGESHVSSLP